MTFLQAQSSGLFAMAGLAEAAVFFMLAVITGFMLFTIGLIAIAWRRKSIPTAAISLVVCGLIAILLQPWAVLASPVPTDSDEAYWLYWLQIFSAGWLFLMLAAIASLAVGIQARAIAAKH